jgi:hypothetical protein
MTVTPISTTQRPMTSLDAETYAGRPHALIMGLICTDDYRARSSSVVIGRLLGRQISVLR